MSIAHTFCHVSPLVAGILLTSFTVDELEALLEAAATALRTERNLYEGLDFCGTSRQFDAETLGELAFEHQSRDELLGLVSAISRPTKYPPLRVGDRILGSVVYAASSNW